MEDRIVNLDESETAYFDSTSNKIFSDIKKKLLESRRFSDSDFKLSKNLKYDKVKDEALGFYALEFLCGTNEETQYASKVYELITKENKEELNEVIGNMTLTPKLYSDLYDKELEITKVAVALELSPNAFRKMQEVDITTYEIEEFDSIKKGMTK